MIQRTFFARGMFCTLAISDDSMLQYQIANCKQTAGADQPCCVVIGVQGSASAAPFAFAETGASPITSTSACSASLTPWPVAPETRSGVFFAARLRLSFYFFS